MNVIVFYFFMVLWYCDIIFISTNVNSGLLSSVASVGFRKVKPYYNIQRKCTGNYNSVVFHNSGVTFGIKLKYAQEQISTQVY